jgi:hypothetical protein
VLSGSTAGRARVRHLARCKNKIKIKIKINKKEKEESIIELSGAGR